MGELSKYNLGLLLPYLDIFIKLELCGGKFYLNTVYALIGLGFIEDKIFNNVQVIDLYIIMNIDVCYYFRLEGCWQTLFT